MTQTTSGWYYRRGDKQFGPVTADKLDHLIAEGKTVPGDLVWRQGMAHWIPVEAQPWKTLQGASQADSQAAPVLPLAPIAAAAPVGVMPAAISYFNPGVLSPRAAAAFRGHARPRGDISEWPLNDAQVLQFKTAMRWRRKMSAASILFRLMFLFTLVSGSIFIAFLADMPFVRMSDPHTVGFLSFITAYAVLLYFAGRATKRSLRWGTVTMGVVFALLTIFFAYSLISNYRPEPEALLFCQLLLVFFQALFSFISFRAFAVTPKYLAQPAWCQELVATAKG